MIASALLVLAFVPAAARADVARLVPPTPGLGETARLELPVAPADSSEWPRGLRAVVRATADPARFEVIAVRVGRAGVTWGANADTLFWEVPGRLDAADPSALRPLRPIGDLGPVWWPLALAVAAAVAGAAFWSWRRRARGRIEGELETALEPAHVVALRRFAEIEAAGWIEAGAFERFYVEASHALRTYVGARYRIDALDQTTAETLERLLAAGYEREAVRAIAPLLESADGVKFAAALPAAGIARDWLESARRFVTQTAVEPVWSTPESRRAARRFAAEGGA